MSSTMQVEEQMRSGQLYPADNPEVLQELRHGRYMSYEYHLLKPSQWVERAEALARMLGKVGQD